MKRLLFFGVLILAAIAAIAWTGRNAKEDRKEATKEFHQLLMAEKAILMDESTGKILYKKASGERCYPASTTKILTALVAMEDGDPDGIVTVGDEANFPEPGSSRAGIQYGEKLTLRQLLNCLLIPSGNDAAYTIAAYIGEKAGKKTALSKREAIEEFCRRMNRKAKELGATDSCFANPDGFHDPNHYTTAYDMTLIAREAMKHKEFREIVKKTRFRLPDIKVKGSNGKMRNQTRILVNTNKLLQPKDENYFSKVTGIKTGHTDEAGYCLISAAQDKGKDVLAVVMHSTENEIWNDSGKLLDWGLNRN